MMNLFKKSFVLFSILSLFILSVLFLGMGTIVSASSVPEGEKAEKMILLAETSIQNGKIISQKGNIFNISFSITNGEGLQTGAKYGIKLLKKTDKGIYTIDEKVYDESLTLNPKTVTQREIKYIAPEFLSGEYTLTITSRNENGFLFGILEIGKVTLDASKEGIEILPETCSFKIVGEKDNTQYTLFQGVDILPTENISLTCNTVNSLKSDISFIPTYETRYHSNYGNIANQTGGDTTPILFKAGEEKSFSLILPKATIPQTYRVSLTLNSDNINSNTIGLSYSLHGASATIQSASLDKDYYTKGETANLSFVYFLSNNPSLESRLGNIKTPTITYNINVSNSKGQVCAEPQSQILSGQFIPKIEVPISITSECFNPKITISLTDSKGTILDQKEFNVVTTTQTSQLNKILSILIILIAIIIIAIVYAFIKKKKISSTNSSNNQSEQSQENQTPNIPMGIIFFFILAVSIFIPKGDVNAAVYYTNGYTLYMNMSPGAPGAQITVNSGDLLDVWGHIERPDGNYASGHIRVRLDGDWGYSNIETVYSCNYSSSQPNINETKTFAAPGYGGTYYMIFDDVVIYTSSSSSGNIYSSGPGQSVTVNGPFPDPVVTVTAYPLTVSSGGTTTITWSSTNNATGCTCASSPSGKCTGFSGSPRDSFTTPPLTSPTTFTITCTN